MYKDVPSDVSCWDNACFQTFIKENAAIFHVFAKKYIEDSDAVDDFLQEAYIRFWTHRQSIGLLKSPRNYFFSIIKNVICDNMDYFPQGNKSYEIETYTNVPDNEIFLQNIIEAESSNLIAQAILKLSPQSSKVILMTMEGKNMKEIAQALDITINTVKTIKYRALKRLSELLSKEDFLLFLLTFEILNC
jgi:RNA polymerase sigma-70 factor (ECF subfamily)